jgi:hypothetical protein
MKNLNKGIFTIAATIVFSITIQAQNTAHDRVSIRATSGNDTPITPAQLGKVQSGYIFSPLTFDGLTIVGGSNTKGDSHIARKINLLGEAGIAVRITETVTGSNTIVHGMYIGGATKYVNGMTYGNKLFVDGGIGCKGKIAALDYQVVTAAAFPDYVFANDYKVPTLSETEAYIKANKHLQAFKSAKELEENGYSVIDMDRSLLQTVEEMTLHAIAQEKEITTLKSEMAAIKALLLKK